MKKTNEQIAMRVSVNTIVVNVILSVLKFAAGIIGHSAAMLSDSVHSLSDVLSTFIVMIGVKFSNKEADHDHQYGHERFECVAAIILSVMLAGTGIGIGYTGIKTIIAGNYDSIVIPGVITLVAAGISIVVKEAMYWYTKKAAAKINSGALMADAWHHRSDALSSVGSLVGIIGARIGYPILDSVACIVICAFILKASVEIFTDAVNKMTDRACDEETVSKFREIIHNHDDVVAIDKLKTRLFGDKIYIDVEISLDADIPLYLSHEIAHEVHDAIEEAFPEVKHCMVHVNPVSSVQNNFIGEI